MKHEGQNVSSDCLNINFRTHENENKLLDVLKNFQNKFKFNGCLEHEIFHENGVPYISVKTNLCERPLKFLIDTGASLSLISKNFNTRDSIPKRFSYQFIWPRWERNTVSHGRNHIHNFTHR